MPKFHLSTVEEVAIAVKSALLYVESVDPQTATEIELAAKLRPVQQLLGRYVRVLVGGEQQ